MDPIPISAISYGHSEFAQRALDPVYLFNHCPLDADFGAGTTSTTLNCDLGFLGLLPPELLLEVLDRLPLRSLMLFRNINHRARRFVDSMPTFMAVRRHAPDTIRGILAIQTTANITLPHLYSKLCQRHCDACGQPAQHLWLASCSRYCFICHHPSGSQNPLPPVQEKELMITYGLESSDLALIPSFRFLPATFTNQYNTLRVEGHHILYDANTAAQLCFARHGVWTWVHSRQAMAEIWSLHAKAMKRYYRTSTQRRKFIVENRYPPIQIRTMMATVIAPWIKAGGAEAENGVFCATCIYTKDQDRVYTPDTFLKHLSECTVGPFVNTFIDIRDSRSNSLLFRISREK